MPPADCRQKTVIRPSELYDRFVCPTPRDQTCYAPRDQIALARASRTPGRCTRTACVRAVLSIVFWGVCSRLRRSLPRGRYDTARAGSISSAVRTDTPRQTQAAP
jgi:hypothetical protein